MSRVRDSLTVVQVPHAPGRSGDALTATVLGIIAATMYTIFSARQWASIVVPSWDLGIFTQLARRYAAVESPIVQIKGEGYNLLGDHFHPLLVLLGPVYAAFPHAFTLLVVQNLLFGLACAVLAHTAMQLLGRGSGLLVGGACAVSWGLQGAVEAQFHEIAFAVPLLALSLTALLRRHFVACAAWAMPLVFVKEDLGLTVAAIGVVLAYRSRTPLGIWLASWGVAWFGVASLIVLPALNPQDEWAYAGSIDLPGLLSDPSSLFHPEKGVTLLMLALAGGFIALRSPLALVLLPTLAWRFVSDNPGYWGHTWQYSAVLMPIVFCALVDAVVQSRASRHRWMVRFGRRAPVIVVIVALALLPQLPLAKLLHPSEHFSTSRAEAAQAAVARVPDNAVVVSDIGLMNYLVDRSTVYWVGNDNPVPDYIVVDLVAGGLPAEWTTVAEAARVMHPHARFQTVFSRDGFEVAERVGTVSRP